MRISNRMKVGMARHWRLWAAVLVLALMPLLGTAAGDAVAFAESPGISSFAPDVDTTGEADPDHPALPGRVVQAAGGICQPAAIPSVRTGTLRQRELDAQRYKTGPPTTGA